jgi:bacteriophage HK97-gp10 putative tail-component
MAIRVTLEGDRAMKQRLSALAQIASKDSRKAARTVMGRKLEIAQTRVPVKEGDLRDSGRIRVSIRKSKSATNIAASMVFGNRDVPYAYKIHEDLTLDHPNGGQAKYAESVIREAVSTAGAELAAEIDLRRQSA